jgi:hypothetical protein
VCAWAEPGRAGWFPEARNGSGAPWSLAGLALGGLWLDEPGGAPLMLPAPGVGLARRALVWNDTLVVRLLDGVASRGFDAGVARLQGTAPAPGRGHAVAVYQNINGSNAYASNALGIERGDSLSGLRVEMEAGDHGALGPFQREGRHVWGASVRGVRGAHQWWATYAQRGASERLADGDEEDAAGESGTLDYRYRARGWWGHASLARGYTHFESFGDTLSYSRRDAQEDRAAAELGGLAAGHPASVRVEWRTARAERLTLERPVFERSVEQFWSAARIERPLGTGRLEGAIGAGHEGGSGRWSLAPDLSAEFGAGERHARLSIGRLLQPVWADLAPGERPFLQSTWAAGAEVGAGGPRFQVRATALAGRAADRALVARLPLAELWMRAGVERDVRRYRFALTSLSGGSHVGAIDGTAEGFLLGRDRDGGQPQVDPSWGARAAAGFRFRAFQRDLGVALRGEVEWVGERETEEAVPRRLAATTSYGAAAVLTLSDATFALRARNLEDRPQPQSWIDPVTGKPALGPGLEVRGAFTWRLFN